MLYYSVILDSDPNPSADQIVAGYGVASGSLADPGDGYYTFPSPASGLTSGLLYVIVYVIVEGLVRSDVVRGPVFLGVSSAVIPTLYNPSYILVGPTSITPKVTIDWP